MKRIIIFWLKITIFVYLIFSFIALDLKPVNWFLFKEEFGRFIFVVLSFVIISIGIIYLRNPKK